MQTTWYTNNVWVFGGANEYIVQWFREPMSQRKGKKPFLIQTTSEHWCLKRKKGERENLHTTAEETSSSSSHNSTGRVEIWH